MDMNKLRNSQGKRGFAGKRKLRFGIFAAVLTLAVVAVVIMLNVAVGAVEANWGLTVDMTRIGATDFSQATFDVLDSFEEPVHIYTVYQPGTSSSLRLQVENILEKYRAYNHNIALEMCIRDSVSSGFWAAVNFSGSSKFKSKQIAPHTRPISVCMAWQFFP